MTAHEIRHDSRHKRLRKKREKYTSAACAECKRRKIKCNGRQPCERCGNQGLKCMYPDTCCANFESSQFCLGLRKRVEELENLLSMGTKTTQGRYFQGQTSPYSTLSRARDTLQLMGMGNGLSEDNETSTTLHPCEAGKVQTGKVQTLSSEEIQNLITVFAEECIMLYPILDVKVLREHLESRTANLALAIALAMEADSLTHGEGKAAASQKIFASIWPAIMTETESSLELAIDLTLSAVYYFHIGDENMAYRMVGLAVRVAFELGLHKGAVEGATDVWWNIYILDKRFSFGVGRPSAVKESDIDTALPHNSYLLAMRDYCKYATEVWDLVTDTNTSEQAIFKLEKDIQEFEINLAPHLKWKGDQDSGSRSKQKQRLLLFLRISQLRILLHKNLLSSTIAIVENEDIATTIVKVAQTVIRTLNYTYHSTELYNRCQLHCNHFLLSALSMLFCAVVHAPAIFSASCSGDFLTAIRLIQKLAQESAVSRRLWWFVKDLRYIGPQLGLIPTKELEQLSPDSKALAQLSQLYDDAEEVHQALDHTHFDSVFDIWRM